MGLSIALNTVTSALLAQQQAMDAVAHNVANVNTPGYSRQRVILTSIAPAGGTGVGGGVSYNGVQRIRDLFVDFQVRTQNQDGGSYQMRSESLHLAELALNEPSDSGLRSVMDSFWNSWRDLSNAPEQGAARSAVVQAGQTFAFTANRLAQSFTDLQNNADARLQDSISEVNDLASRIAALNGQIISVRATGDPAGDLTDKRDLALDRLSQLVGLQYQEQDGGRLDVFVGGRALVDGVNAAPIQLVRNPLNNNYVDLQWASDAAPVLINGGEVGGLLYQRDVDLPGRLADLNALLGQVITDVNTVHAAGYAQDGVTTATLFFSGTGAADIAVDAAVAANLGLVAAATAAAAVGDGSNAIAIASLQFAKNLSGGSETYGDFYNGVVTKIGVAVRDTQGLAAAQQLTVDHLQQLRQSTSGVNLDEEMVNMVQYQRGYESAARVIRAVDEMLDTLINRM